MALIACKECGKEMSNTAKTCPHCGFKNPRPSIWPLVVGIPVFFIVLLAVIPASPEAKEKQHARDAISLCWKEQASKSLDPATQRFAASTCEYMEKNFRDRYHTDP